MGKGSKLFLTLAVVLGVLMTTRVTAQQNVVAQATRGYFIDDAGEVKFKHISMGTLLEKESDIDSLYATYLDSTGGKYILRKWHLETCYPDKPSRRQIMRAQSCLDRRGYNPKGVDGVMGPGSVAALKKFVSRKYKLQGLSQSCQLAVVCYSPANVKFAELEKNVPEFWKIAELTKTERLLRKRATKLFNAGKCEELKSRFIDRYRSEVFFDIDMQGCVDFRNANKAEKVAKAQARAAKRAKDKYSENLKNLKCAEADKYPEKQTGDIAKCARNVAYNAAKKTLDCDRVQELAAEFDRSGDLSACRKSLERKIATDDLAIAMAAADCDAVKRLSEVLGVSGRVEQCRFRQAMSTDSARTAFLIAARFDAAKDHARAKTIYSDIMSRFENDDLSIQAALRLTALGDLERTEQARREMEAEMAKLQREARDAQRKAQEAQRQAERARADADRRAAAAARAQSNVRRGPCGRLNIGYSFPYRVNLFGVSVPQGDARIIGMNPNAGTALVEYFPAGSPSFKQHVRCKNIP